MVRLFSRFSTVRDAHRRTQSATELTDASASTGTVVGPVLSTTASHGTERPAEFKPVEHPTEPLIQDQPVKCPLPEPSILNDGRIWKEHMSANARAKAAELSAAQEGPNPKSGTCRARSSTGPSGHEILPTQSASEHNITDLPEECNAAGT